MQFIDPEPLDDHGKLWRAIMTIMRTSPLSQAEKLGIIEFIKHEMLTDMLSAKNAVDG